MSLLQGQTRHASKKHFFALDVLKYASIASSEGERIRHAVAGLDGIAMQQARALDSISSVAKLQKEALEDMESIARQARAFEGINDFATRQVKAALESVRYAGLSSRIHRDARPDPMIPHNFVHRERTETADCGLRTADAPFLTIWQRA